MKANLTKQLAAGMLAFALCAPTVHAQNAPKMKMTTPVPPGITTPDSVETRLGTLRFTDGFPDDSTIEKEHEAIAASIVSRRACPRNILPLPSAHPDHRKGELVLHYTHD